MRLLEIFNGDTGGAGCIGYKRAGWEVTRLPFAEGMAVLPLGWVDYDAVHVQPSCKGYTAGTRAARAAGRVYPRQIEQARSALSQVDVPWVIENVGAARSAMVDPVVLCGSMFRLRARDTDGELLWLQRHRLFETNWELKPPGPCDHPANMRCGGVYGAARTNKYEAQFVRKGGYNPPREVQENLMGVPHGQFTRKALKGAIPPAYTEWIGGELCKAL